MDLIYRQIDSSNYDEVYQFILMHEWSGRDSLSGYRPDSETERDLKTRNLMKELDRCRLENEKKYLCQVVCDGEKMIAGIFLNRYKIEGRFSCHIHGLWVDENYRKLGIGKKLKSLAEQWARESSCEWMDSNVNVANTRMIRLNESLGYTVARLNFRKKL